MGADGARCAGCVAACPHGTVSISCHRLILSPSSCCQSRRPPIIQTTPARATALVWLFVVLSVGTYVRFCYLVIQDITEHLGIACFTVRKRDKSGAWRSTDPNAAAATPAAEKTVGQGVNVPDGDVKKRN